MSATKHTPGPWAFDDDNAVMADVGAHICTVSMADDFPCIDDDEGDSRTNVDIECKANARLIAAAPDLLEALVEILGPLNVCSDNQNVGDDVCLPVDMTMGELRKARAAIAKAEGRP
ncbi:hypothetical protein [Rhizobiales bacterium]|uniref:hypothetical protein n=1 Tax=Ensifer sp. R-19 TaxID=3404055 RepID=UPI000DDDA67F